MHMSRISRDSCGRVDFERGQGEARSLNGDAAKGDERVEALRSLPATICTAVQLRRGDVAAPLFLLPGVGCELNELQHLVRNIRPGP